METIEKTTSAELKDEALRQIQDYTKRNSYFNKNRLLEHVCDDLLFDSSTKDYDTDILYGYVMLCQELLSLLTNPKVSSLLSIQFQEEGGKMIFNLMRFFEHVQDPVCLVLYDLYTVENAELSDNFLLMTIKEYRNKA